MPIARKDVEVIFHPRKSVLYNDRELWVKKDGGSFDVTIRAYDGVEVCELISIYMLYLIRKKYDSKDIVLHRDEGLAVFKNVSGPGSEKKISIHIIYIYIYIYRYIYISLCIYIYIYIYI